MYYTVVSLKWLKLSRYVSYKNINTWFKIWTSEGGEVNSDTFDFANV